MKYSIIVLNSITTAKRIESLATQENIKCSVINTPKNISKKGCSHAVKFEDRYTSMILNIINQLSVSYNGIYHEYYENGEIKYRERNK